MRRSRSDGAAAGLAEHDAVIHADDSLLVASNATPAGGATTMPWTPGQERLNATSTAASSSRASSGSIEYTEVCRVVLRDALKRLWMRVMDLFKKWDRDNSQSASSSSGRRS